MISIEREVSWGELDALGHVNNTVFFRWFEDARIACFQQIGVAAAPPVELGPILATTTAEFLRPVGFPGRVRIECTIPKVGNSSFVQAYTVFDVETDEVVGRGSGVIVMVQYSSGKPVPVPEAVREAITLL